MFFHKKLSIVKHQKKTVSFLKANLLGLLPLPALGSLLIPYYYLWGFPLSLESHLDRPINILLFFLAIVLSILIHESIHAICFMLFARKGYKSVKIGVMWKYLTPYAHCREPLRKFHYRIALLMPCLILGVIPILIGILFGYFLLFVFGLFLMLAAGGDLIIFVLTYSVPSNKKILDHPSECGFFIVD